MPARTVRDYENIIARLRALPAYIDQSIESDARAARGRPRAAGGRRRPDARSGGRAGELRRRTSRRCWRRFGRFPADIAAADQDRLRAQARSAYTEQFVPSWKRLETFLRDTYLKAGPRADRRSARCPMARAAYASLIHALHDDADDAASRFISSACRKSRASRARWRGVARDSRLHRHRRRVRARAGQATRRCSFSEPGGDAASTRETCWRASSRSCRGCSSAFRG